MGIKHLVIILLGGAFIAAGCNRTVVLPSNKVTPVPTPPANRSVATTPTPGDTTPRKVSFVSAGDVKIWGTFYPAAQANSPAILMLHQWMSDRTAYDELAKRMQAAGMGVLAIDGRGFGESVKAADGTTLGPSRTNEAVEGMKADVTAAWEFLSKQDNVDATRMGIIGASYGSSLAIIHAAEDPKVKAVALLSPGLNYFGNLPTDPAVRKYGNRPMLLVAAEDDKESAGAVKKLKDAGNSDAHDLQIYKKGGHGTALLGAGLGLEELVEAFFVKRFTR
jgi:dienelactone hydrolase